MPELSVILATINDSIACNLTCSHILAQLERDEIDYEILLIDNNSLPQEKILLEQFLAYHKNFPIRYFNFNIPGTIPIHAFGISQAQGKYITMPEPHVILSSHYYLYLLDTLKKLKEKNVEMMFSSFSTGSIVKKDDFYLGETIFNKQNPFGRVNSGGGSICKRTDPPKPIFTGVFSGMVCEKEWMLKIGNMFPDAFSRAGGYIAEAILIGLLTWMFGKKCYVEPKAMLDHPVYRIEKGPGRNEHMHYSMAVGSYICGGDKYLNLMEESFGDYPNGLFEKIREEAKEAREYVKKNAIYDLNYLAKYWDEINL